MAEWWDTFSPLWPLFSEGLGYVIFSWEPDCHRNAPLVHLNILRLLFHTIFTGLQSWPSVQSHKLGCAAPHALMDRSTGCQRIDRLIDCTGLMLLNFSWCVGFHVGGQQAIGMNELKGRDEFLVDCENGLSIGGIEQRGSERGSWERLCCGRLTWVGYSRNRRRGQQVRVDADRTRTDEGEFFSGNGGQLRNPVTTSRWLFCPWFPVLLVAAGFLRFRMIAAEFFQCQERSCKIWVNTEAVVVREYQTLCQSHFLCRNSQVLNGKVRVGLTRVGFAVSSGPLISDSCIVAGAHQQSKLGSHWHMTQLH